MLNYSFSVVWSGEDAAYVATSPEFPGLSGVNPSAEEAIGELREAIEMALEDLADERMEPPVPLALVEHSGQFRLRVPKWMHAELAKRALQDEVSLNTYAISLIASGLGDVRVTAQLHDELRSLLRDLRACVPPVEAALAAARAANVTTIPEGPEFRSSLQLYAGVSPVLGGRH